MLELTLKADTPYDLCRQMETYLSYMKGNTPVDLMATIPAEPEPIKPVLTQEQMAENLANAPEHKEPPQPTLEEVRAVLKKYRDEKGVGAVKELLKAFKANSVTELQPEDYLGAIDRARAEA